MFTGIDPGEVRHPALWTLGAEAQALGRLAAEIDLGAVDELVAALYDAPMIVLAGVGKSVNGGENMYRRGGVKLHQGLRR